MITLPPWVVAVSLALLTVAPSACGRRALRAEGDQGEGGHGGSMFAPGSGEAGEAGVAGADGAINATLTMQARPATGPSTVRAARPTRRPSPVARTMDGAGARRRPRATTCPRSAARARRTSGRLAEPARSPLERPFVGSSPERRSNRPGRRLVRRPERGLGGRRLRYSALGRRVLVGGPSARAGWPVPRRLGFGTERRVGRRAWRAGALGRQPMDQADSRRRTEDSRGDLGNGPG